MTNETYALKIEDDDREKLAKRFLKYISIPEDKTQCWIWTGSLSKCSPDGVRRYGNFWFLTQPVYAHRISYALWNAPIPLGKQINHKCDNPLCVNPDHLEIGTPKSNILDAMKRNRIRNCQHHGKAKLKDSQVEVILSLKGRVTQKQIARMFNVSETTISAIMNNKLWSKLNTPCEFGRKVE